MQRQTFTTQTDFNLYVINLISSRNTLERQQAFAEFNDLLSQYPTSIKAFLNNSKPHYLNQLFGLMEEYRPGSFRKITSLLSIEETGKLIEDAKSPTYYKLSTELKYAHLINVYKTIYGISALTENERSILEEFIVTLSNMKKYRSSLDAIICADLYQANAALIARLVSTFSHTTEGMILFDKIFDICYRSENSRLLAVLTNHGNSLLLDALENKLNSIKVTSKTKAETSAILFRRLQEQRKTLEQDPISPYMRAFYEQQNKSLQEGCVLMLISVNELRNEVTSLQIKLKKSEEARNKVATIYNNDVKLLTTNSPHLSLKATNKLQSKVLQEAYALKTFEQSIERQKQNILNKLNEINELQTAISLRLTQIETNSRYLLGVNPDSNAQNNATNHNSNDEEDIPSVSPALVNSEPVSQENYSEIINDDLFDLPPELIESNLNTPFGFFHPSIEPADDMQSYQTSRKRKL